MATDLTRLKAALLISGLQQKDIGLFNIIDQLIDAIRNFEKSIVGTGSGGGSSGSVSLLLNRTYLTVTNETGVLSSSRRLLAGTGITFDDTVAGIRTIDGSVAVATKWSVLSDGNLIEPELIFAGGEVIMLHIP